MMNPDFDAVIAAPAEDRLGLFNATAARMGTTPQNVEKDFWVTWTLDALFNGLPAGGPRLLFKGGTSLSKAHGLISRFSEDIDVTVFRQDLGEGASIADLQALSGNRRKAWLEHLRATCAAYIQGPLHAQLTTIAVAAAERAGLDRAAITIAIDTGDPDGQSLLVVYPSVSAPDDYIAPTVKIESGARSALDPHASRIIRPYVEADADQLDLAVGNVITVDPERTFWDKVLIAHGLRSAFDAKGVLRGEGQRVSRHYYDLYRLLEDERSARAMADAVLSEDCAAHAKLFFNRPDANLDAARAPTYALRPRDEMIARLARDYDLMRRMIFGTAPDFDAVLERIATLEARLNV